MRISAFLKLDPLLPKQVVDDMGNIKFALDAGPDSPGNSWLKYVRSAPSFQEQNLAACHLTGDQVSVSLGFGVHIRDTLFALSLSHDSQCRFAFLFPIHSRVISGFLHLLCVCHCGCKTCWLVMTKEWFYCVAVTGPVARVIRK